MAEASDFCTISTREDESQHFTTVALIVLNYNATEEVIVVAALLRDPTWSNFPLLFWFSNPTDGYQGTIFIISTFCHLKFTRFVINYWLKNICYLQYIISLLWLIALKYFI